MYKSFLKIDKNYVQEYLNMGYEIPYRLKKAVFKRQNEFAAGRLCAIDALRGLLGEFDGEIKQDEYCRPVWPNHVIGSISHTDQYSVALVDHKGKFLSLGADIEHIDPSKEKLDSIKSLVMTDIENSLLNKFTGDDDEFILNIPYIIFSAKESLFKCINPLINIIFDFKDVETVDIDFNKNKIKLTLLKQIGGNHELLRGQNLTGHFSFLSSNELIYTQVGYESDAD